MRISVTLAYQYDTVFSPFRAEDFEAGLAWAAGLGFDGVELTVAYPEQVRAARLCAQLARYGLAVTTLSTGQIVGREGVFLTHPNEAMRRRALDVLCRHIELSAQMGCPPVTVGLIRGAHQDMPADRQAALLEEGLARAAALAGEAGVKLSIEPINRYETPLLNTCEQVLALVRNLGDPPSVGVLFDIFHANIEETSLPGTLVSLGPKLLNVHFADSNRLLPGRGHLPLVDVLDVLNRSGYAGGAALECSFSPDSGWTNAQVAHALAILRRQAA